MIGQKRQINNDGDVFEVVAVYDNTNECGRCVFSELHEDSLYHLCPKDADGIDCAINKFVWIEINVDK